MTIMDEVYVEMNMKDETTEPNMVLSPEETEHATLGSAPETLSHVPVLRQLAVALSILFVVFGATYLGTIATLARPIMSSQDLKIEAEVTQSASSTPVQNPFDNTVLTARAAFVWDVKKQRILFNKNGDDVLPLASITKMMTTLVSYELLTATDTVRISKAAIKTSGDSGFREGETFTAHNLSNLTLIESSNDGAVALSEAGGNATGMLGSPEATFVAAMNMRAKQLSLHAMNFSNVTGLDLSTTTSGAYGSARDVSLLMEYIITHYPDVLALTRMDMTTVNNTSDEYHTAKNTNTIVNKIDGLIASKTGYTTLAGGNLVVAVNVGLNHPIIITVLDSTESGRFDDVLNLVNRARAYANQTK